MKLVSIVIAVGASLASLVTAMPESTLAIMNTANTASSFLDDKKIDNYQLVSILEAAAASTNAANVEDITQRLIALMDARMEAKAIKGLVESSMQQLELLGAREEEIAKVLEEVSIGEETVQVLQDLLMVSDEQQKYVDLHNKIRRQHNITAKFSWDRSLERSALEAAEIRARSECYVKSFSSLVDAGIENLGEEQSDRFKSDSYPSDLAHAFIGGSNSKNTITNAIEFWGDNNSHKSENSIGMTMSPSLMQILSPTATRVGCAEAVAQQTSGPLADYGSCKMVVCHYNKRNSNNNKQKKSEKSPKPKQSKETPHKKTSKKPQPHNPPVSESGPATPPQSPPPPSPKLKTNRPRRTSSPKPYPPPVFSSPEHHHDQPVVSGSHRQAALDAHNSARAQLGISPISWSSNLEASANVIAEQLSSRGCGLVHSGTLGVGENLYMYGGDLFGGQMSDGVAAWNAEGYSGASNDFNHYTQVIWRDTEQVGCARSSSSSYGSECSVTVCHYHPPGNVISQSPY